MLPNKKVSLIPTGLNEEIISGVCNLGQTTRVPHDKHKLDCAWYSGQHLKCSCGLIQPVQHAAPTSPPPYTHFITMCFPTNSMFKIKHKIYKTNGMVITKFCPIKFGACDQEEQYNFIKWKMNKHFQYFDCVDAFFEQTKIGNIHVHMRVITNNNIKHIRCFLHRIYEVDIKHHAFLDIKKYIDSSWNEYERKEDKKAYQVTSLPHFVQAIKSTGQV